VKGDVGSIGQNHIRPNVMQQMADEMLCCDIDEFLRHYAPFCPTEKSIDGALENLERNEILQGDGWRDFRNNDKPSNTGKAESEAFEKLKDIVQVLTKRKCFGTDSKASRKCNLSYHICGEQQMVGEIPGSTFRIDAYLSPTSPPPQLREVVVSQVAVAAEFKRKKNHFRDVRTQILNIDVS